MKTRFLIFVSLIFFVSFTEIYSQPSPQPDTLKIYRKWSLFSEYHKNGDYETALPYGFEILEINPGKFKTIFLKLEDCLIYLHDSTNVDEATKKMYADTLMYVYDLAIKTQPENAAYYYKKMGYYLETWYSGREEEAIKAYEKAYELDKDLDFYYLDRLGLLYVKMANDENNYRLKAFEIYQEASSKDPNNPIPLERMKSLAENIEQLIEITYNAWKLDPENLQKAWQYASITYQTGEYEKAIEPLEFLVKKDPSSETYWSRLATCYQKTEKYSKAIDAYKKAMEINKQVREYPLNMGICYKELGQFATARNYFYRAAEIDKNWGLPYIYEATLYQAAVQKCGSFEFMDKVVLQLAVDTYRKAKSVDPSVANIADDAIKSLANSVPTKEEYFFRRLKSGTVIKIEGPCYNWIGKSITVP
ncbi:MAG: tetratricopeptide repeat protein [Ignavibacteria bacterium]|jgi:tetratricopeptide (TPR) repeat protein|nr:tetratricopeptide repeat protein [Ignavibacteria bacterium]MDH7528786.1 tetratricopeptide repeat protein [Ignavibacteria bacterium]